MTARARPKHARRAPNRGARPSRSARTPAPSITPLRVPASAPGVVVFGGSFDPPHRWHVRVAAAVRRRLFGEGGWIVFVPAAHSPLKAEGPTASAGDRVAMLRLAILGLKNASVWTDEIERARRGGGASYSVDTLRRLRRLMPSHEVRLLIGADQAAAFHRWKNPDRLLRLATPAVVWRPPVDTPRRLRRALRAAASDRPAEFWLPLIVPAPTHPMSSTQVRRLLGRRHATGRATAGLKRMLDPGVLRYIRRRGLYGP